ncbi:hypothetical protein [Pseudomonas sp. B21-053]|uniref:hypothetical protein n=1 Tax=Pseudomonas sp. B21-053 TaxID=2895493 RepID=UPI002232A0EF|nr:hypothetical protein [Pseudomonas sp. B21-053]UZE12756.1 hypothetical protein LOY68_03860 [Pseudomonas sp. B21-053]
MSQRVEKNPVGVSSEFAGLGARLVRFGHALQEGSTTVGELVTLAQACGINFKLRVISESSDNAER